MKGVAANKLLLTRALQAAHYVLRLQREVAETLSQCLSNQIGHATICHMFVQTQKTIMQRNCYVVQAFI